MRERMQSGSSIKAFCKQIGICENTYFYWQRRVRAAACLELADIKNESENALVPKGWAQVCESKAAPAVSNVLSVQVGDFRLCVDKGTDLQLLAEVCRTLKAL